MSKESEKAKFNNKIYGNGSGFLRAVKALQCSLLGFKAAFQHESAFRQELALSLFFIPYGVWLGENVTQKILLITLVIIVLIVELLNSAIEAVVDRVGLEYHELSGRAKDLGSAAVFLSLVLTGVSYLYLSYLRFFN